MEQFGYFGIFLMLAFENIFPPIPSEVILPFGGFMTTTTSLTIPGVIIAATAGSLLGAVILYYIGRLLDVSRLEKLVERWGSLIRVSKKISTRLTPGLINMATGLYCFVGWFRWSAV